MKKKYKIHYLLRSNKIVIDDELILINSEKHKAKFPFILNPENPLPEGSILTDGILQEFKELWLFGLYEKKYYTMRFAPQESTSNVEIQDYQKVTNYWDPVISAWENIMNDPKQAPLIWKLRQNIITGLVNMIGYITIVGGTIMLMQQITTTALALTFPIIKPSIDIPFQVLYKLGEAVFEKIGILK